ncbi:MAG: dephospho-CoA kinase [Saprospiraceae bacterium]|nr:dephospho-CoA kinase [Saprospiraceae bacterium]
MKKIGITGGIGSGKTTVCKIFETLDVPVYYADIEAKKIMSSNASVKKQIKDLLGDEAYFNNGRPDRTFISSRIFSDKALLEGINKIVHPAVQIETARWIENLNGRHPYVLCEAALLVENGSYRNMDGLIVVTCPENIRIHRVMGRDKLSFTDVVKKVKNQLPEETKIKVADFIIKNDGTLPLINQVWEIHKKILKK